MFRAPATTGRDGQMTYEPANLICAPYWTNVFQSPTGTTHMEPCRTCDDAVDEIFHELVPDNATYIHTIACFGDGSPLIAMDLMPMVEERRHNIQEEVGHEKLESMKGIYA